MARRRVRATDCPLSLALDVLGDRWSLLVVRDLVLRGKQRYSELLANNRERIATNILAERLRRLEAAGVVTWVRHRIYRHSRLYRLTDRGNALLPVIAHLSEWGLARRAQGGLPLDPRLSRLAACRQHTRRAFRAEVRAAHSTFQPTGGWRRLAPPYQPVLDSLDDWPLME